MILIQLMELHFAGKRPHTDSTALCGRPDFSSEGIQFLGKILLFLLPHPFIQRAALPSFG